MNDLSRMYLCSSHPTTGWSNIVPRSTSGAQKDKRMKGRNTRLEKIVFRKRTGSTALSRNDSFLKAS